MWSQHLQTKEYRYARYVMIAGLVLAGHLIFDTEYGHAAYTQNVYRWYQAKDAVDPDTALAAENTTYTLTTASTSVRLRMNITTDTAVATGTVTFKPQYAFSTSGPWTDVTDPWWDGTMAYRRKITVGSTTNALTDFPLPVFLYGSTTASNLANNIDYSKAQSDGADIRFTTASGTPLQYEIERWNTNATSTIWVKIPSIATTTWPAGLPIQASSTYIWMYYGNSSTTSNATTTGVWDSNYMGVWHMSNQTSGAGAFKDSAGVAQNGTGNGSLVLASTTGMFGGAWQFDRTTTYVSIANHADLNPSSLTISGWWYRTGGSADGGFAGKWSSSTGYLLWSGSVCCTPGIDNEMVVSINGGNDRDTGVLPALNTWYNWAETYTPSTQRGYINGTERVNATGATLTNTSLTFEIGRYAEAAGFGVAGIIDEVRLSNVARSGAWLNAEFNSGWNPNFNQYGPEESLATTTTWRFGNATSTIDNATTTSLLLTGSNKSESYEEASSTAPLLSALAANQNGEFDFNLDSSQATSTNTYYFRLINATSSAALNTYTNYPTITVNTSSGSAYTQRTYQWFLNQNSPQPGSSKKIANAPITDVDNGSTNRLRMDVSVATANLVASGQQFILQYKTIGAGCSAAETWTSVGNATSTAIWRGALNANATDGTAISAALLNASNILASYNDFTAASFTNPNAINAGQAGEWDWSLYDNSAAVNTTYCFRMAKTGGTALDTYTNYPQLTTSSISQGRPGGSGSGYVAPVETPRTGATSRGAGTTTDAIPPPAETPTPSTPSTPRSGGGESARAPLASRFLASVAEGFRLFIDMFR